jgi:glycosyltransferase involved in cell wall biosynthesis
MVNKADIAVIILTFNESLHLPRCLAHIAGFAREIFVVDSYSTDTTIEQARAGGAVVFQHPFQNQAQQFQWALEHCPITAAWVMRLDADEVIEADLAQEIVTRLPQLAPEITGIVLNRKTIFQGRFLRHGGRYPLMLLRIWRRGCARIENRWMDEHIYLTQGSSVTFQGGFADHNLHDLTAFVQKHNQYATREALDVLNKRLSIGQSDVDLSAVSAAGQARQKRFWKERIYNRIPFELAALGYFVLRYVIQLGFLDGREGLTYHVLQGFWYRFLAGAKLRELERAIKKTSSPAELHGEIMRVTGRRLD